MGIQISARSTKTNRFLSVNEDDWSPNYTYSNATVILGVLGLISSKEDVLGGEVSLEDFQVSLDKAAITLKNSGYDVTWYNINLMFDGQPWAGEVAKTYLDSALLTLRRYAEDAAKAGADLISWS